jgi:hypothetical protein
MNEAEKIDNQQGNGFYWSQYRTERVACIRSGGIKAQN